jgi:hypothetical protein
VTTEKLKKNKIKQILKNYRKNPILSPVPVQQPPQYFMGIKKTNPLKISTQKIFLTNKICQNSIEKSVASDNIFISVKRGSHNYMSEEGPFSNVSKIMRAPLENAFSNDSVQSLDHNIGLLNQNGEVDRSVPAKQDSTFR